MSTHDYFGSYSFGFPPHRNEHKISQFGCYTAGVPGCFWYTEVNNYGLFLHREDYYEKGEKREGIWLDQILARVDQSLEAAKQLYEKSGYWGNIRFTFHLENLFGKNLKQNLDATQWFHGEPVSPDDRCDVERFFNVSELKDRLQWLVLEIIQEISWNFGFKINLQTARRFLEGHKRWVVPPTEGTTVK